MDDLISRQAAIDRIEEHIRVGDELYPLTETDRILNHAFEIAASCVYNLPSAERKKGRWELAEDGWYCSSCELYAPFDCDPEEKGIPFCPWCGADMRPTEVRI